MMKRNNVVIGCLGGLLLLAAGGLYCYNYWHGDRIDELEHELAELRQKEKQAAIDRSVSHQMEEIANGQQVLAEERSQEAIRQSEIAQAATQRAETERNRALEAQSAAEVSAWQARQSAEMAERQRIEAEAQRFQAVRARQKTDTLNYIMLGRTLGTQAYAIYQTGDREIGNMLAYAAYLYTLDYGGDLYTPSVFQALAQSAGGRRDRTVHRGSISRIDIIPTNGNILTASTYGELFSTRKKGSQLVTNQLVNDRTYCFRDALPMPDGKIYAISHTGHLLAVGHNGKRVMLLEHIDKPFSLLPFSGSELILIVGEHSAAIYDTRTDRVLSLLQLDFRVVCAGRRDYRPLLFDDKGRMHLVSSTGDMTSERLPVNGRVTAYASSKNEHLAVYGMIDGTIWLVDSKGGLHKLVGHLSQVTKMKFNGKRLYSSSYDGKLLFWMVGSGQIKPITLFQSNSWLMDFTFDKPKEHIWTGQTNGTMTEYLFSLPLIGQRIRQNVKRNFTQAEWDYYVGKDIPYRTLNGER